MKSAENGVPTIYKRKQTGMPSLFPGLRALSDAFASSLPPYPPTNTEQRAKSNNLARSELYSAWSVADDAKAKTAQLSDAAVKEFNKASDAAQAKAGKIELYSAKYYAACTFGGLLACVGTKQCTRDTHSAHWT